jgi:hypothetical protein
MDILSMLGNIPGWIFGAIGGAIGAGILAAVYGYFRNKIRSMASKGANFCVQAFTYYCLYNLFIKKIPNTDLRGKVQKDLDHSGNDLNTYWDKGIYGEKPTWKN